MTGLARKTMVAALSMALLTATPGQAQTFVNATASSGTVVNLYSTSGAWGDYDNDSDLDLYVTNWGTAQGEVPTNALYQNNGDDTFNDVAATAGVANDRNSAAAAWGDYDNDGDLDLYVADHYEQDYLYENTEGVFTEVGRARAMVNLIKMGEVTSVAWGDYDNDGYLDLYIGKFHYDNALYRNNTGTLEQVLDLGVGDQRDTNGLTWVDYDNDGDLDLYTVNREQENGLFRNEDAGAAFRAIACAATVANTEIGQSDTWGDYDNDGDLDLYLANVGANNLYRNDGNDTFNDVAAAAGVRDSGSSFITAMSTWIDFDGDGNLDLFLANGGDKQQQPDVLFASNGNGSFRDATSEATLPPSEAAHLSVSWGDLDGDGAPDLYVTDGWGQGNRLFHNTADDSRFIKVFVRGKGSDAGGNNLFGLGAQVRLFDAATDSLVAYTQILSGPNPPEAIFGAPAGPYNVQVRFPGNEIPMIVGNVSGGDKVPIEEP